MRKLPKMVMHCDRESWPFAALCKLCHIQKNRYTIMYIEDHNSLRKFPNHTTAGYLCWFFHLWLQPQSFLTRIILPINVISLLSSWGLTGPVATGLFTTGHNLTNKPVCRTEEFFFCWFSKKWFLKSKITQIVILNQKSKTVQENDFKSKIKMLFFIFWDLI